MENDKEAEDAVNVTSVVSDDSVEAEDALAVAEEGIRKQVRATLTQMREAKLEYGDDQMIGQIAAELGVSASGVHRITDHALAKSRWAQHMFRTRPKAMVHMLLVATVDYINYLKTSGELTDDDVALLKKNPEMVQELDGFKWHLDKYIKRAGYNFDDYSGKKSTPLSHQDDDDVAAAAKAPLISGPPPAATAPPVAIPTSVPGAPVTPIAPGSGKQTKVWKNTHKQHRDRQVGIKFKGKAWMPTKVPSNAVGQPQVVVAPSENPNRVRVSDIAGQWSQEWEEEK